MIVVIFDFNACSVTASIVFHVLSSPCSAETIFSRFIVAVQRGNNICAILSSPRGAGTISLPFYRHRAARKQYLCHFIVTVQRGNNICAILSSSRGAGTIFLPFYRHRSAREQYFCISVLAASLRALKFLFPPLQNGDVCWNGRGGCVCARLNVRVAAFPYLIDAFSNREMEGLSFCSKNVVSI